METAPPSRPWLTLCLLGGCDLNGAEGLVRLETAKTGALLAYLALRSGPQRRQQLMGLLWGNQPEANAYRSLRHALWNIRRQTNHPDHPPLILSDQRTITFNREADCRLDVQAFEEYLNESTRSADQPFACLRDAMSLYRGDLLEGIYAEQRGSE